MWILLLKHFNNLKAVSIKGFIGLQLVYKPIRKLNTSWLSFHRQKMFASPVCCNWAQPSLSGNKTLSLAEGPAPGSAKGLVNLGPAKGL